MIKHLAGKTIFISGASRGIGKAIALRAARDGANIIIAAKTADPHPKLPGTIYSVAKEIEDAGGRALPCMVDIRYEDQVIKAMEDGAKKFGGIDILVNNASAISLTGTLETPMKKYDLMNQVNARGTYMCSRVALPYLLKAKNPHILNLSPPLSLNPKWFKNNVAYTIAKYGMSFCVLGMSEEFKDQGVAVNALWPKTAISTDAIDLIAGEEMRKQSRTVDIMADAAYHILTKDSRSFTGNFVVDETILRQECGVTDFDKYAVVPGTKNFLLDFFLDENEETGELLENKVKKTETPAASPAAASSNDVTSAMGSLKNLINADLVKSVNGVYSFNISDASPADWYLDLKNGNGALGSGAYDGKVDCSLSMNTDVFNKLTSGSMKATSAFMSGKLKIKGNMGLAMKLEKLMGSVKSVNQNRKMSTATPVNDVTPSMDKLKSLITPDLVKSVNGVYSFNITDATPAEWYLDLKNGEGKLESGPFDGKVDCSLTMNTEVFNKLVGGSLKASAAFMGGKLKLKGNMGMAMKLEKVMGSLKSKL